jgi:copper chaperone CopZ
MKLPRVMLLSVLSLALVSLGSARAEVTIELKNVHLCCGQCVKAVAATLKPIEGVKPKCDQKAGIVTISATDDAAAQKAINALAEAGFHGKSSNDKLAMKDDSGVKAGKVKSITLTGIHNCCGMCCKGIKEIVKKVDGVSGDTAKPKVNTFEVTGDFDAAALVKALNDAGFHVKVKK